MVEANQEIVVVRDATYVEVLLWQTASRTAREAAKVGTFQIVDQRYIAENRRVVERRLTAPLAFVVAEEESLTLIDGPAKSEAVLVLVQFLEELAAAEVGSPGVLQVGKSGAARMLWASIASL